MKKIYIGLLAFLGLHYTGFSQCLSANVKATSTINTPNHALNTSFNSGPTATGTIPNLSSGIITFTGSVAGGTATWSNGVQLQNDATVGNYIYVQPNNTNNVTTTKVATYTIQFSEAVTNYSMRCAGLNNQDQLRITAFNGATPITITNANFSDNVADPGNGGVIAISNGNTLTGNNTAGGTGVTTNRITLTLPGPVTSIVMVSGKADNNNSTVTLGFTSVSYTRCVKAQPDLNATFVNTAISGNVGTNDVKPSGTTYGAATAVAGNPGPAVPTVSSSGAYTFTSAVAGVFKFKVPMCPGSVTVPDCANIDLTITVNNATAYTNKPFANTDMATTSLNTPVTLKTLANDKGGSNTTVTLNPATVTITAAPLHGNASVNTTTGDITFTPTTGYTGYDTLTYQVCDRSSPTPQCAIANQIITITPASSTNSTLAADDYNSTPLNLAISDNVKNNDTDPEGNSQTVTAQNTTIPGTGTLVLSTNGNYTFTPANGFTGAVNFPYQVCDNGTPSACTGATLYMLIYPSAILPLDLISFIANVNNGNTSLTWTTENQVYVNRFEIERASSSASDYVSVGTVAVNNTTSGRYTFTDVNAGSLMQKSFYYRLKIIDNDGHFKYSSVILVNFENNRVATIRPTWVKAGESVTLYTSASATQQSFTGELYNPAGQLIGQWKGIAGSLKQIETANLQKGIYIVRIVQQGTTTTQKFIVQ